MSSLDTRESRTTLEGWPGRVGGLCGSVSECLFLHTRLSSGLYLTSMTCGIL